MECARTLRNLSRCEVPSPVHFDVADEFPAPERMTSNTPEENTYATCIVAHFRSGSMQIPDGSTLRAVLADRLDSVSI